jgi:NAD+ synthase
MNFTMGSIYLDTQVETERLTAALKETVAFKLKKRGAVVGVSGGIDSSVVLALCEKTFGPEKVLAIMMPERDSSPESEELRLFFVRNLKSLIS